MNIEEYKNYIKNITFYGAIKLDIDGEAYMDMAAARIIWMDNLRTLRNIKLKELDIPSLRALEDNDHSALADVKSKKNILRNMPQSYDLSLADTWQDLLNMWPEYLL